ncbi:zinc finger protein 26-like [Colias croceus]|uniref:zinc finger protein 26-like n=1 Tax=Colias crocea TaxID=72248 RepID=UPI001E27F1A9|nr:zinc finger protein 26-like [Colias croceus]
MSYFSSVNISVIVSNILNENRFSHCRLCLRGIEENYVRLSDPVSLNPNGGDFQPLYKLLSKQLGKEFSEEIPGIDAVCIDCMESVQSMMHFIHRCQQTTEILSKVFENISKAFQKDTHACAGDKNIFINVEETEADLLFMSKPIRKKKFTKKNKHFECLECLKLFETFDSLNEHNISFHSSVTCGKCNKTFETNLDLSLHDSREHRYKCPECSHYQGTKEGLKKHEEEYHKCHVCTDCGKSCKGLERLRAHEERHRMKHSCPKCGKSYTTKDFYDRHVKLCLNNLLEPHPSRSSMDKSYICEKCDKAYSTQGGLRVHNRFAHGNAKPHECPECGKKFTAPSYLRVHMIKHTGEKNFKCNICNNRFVSKEALLYHTRRHTGEKPYSCKLCSERFVNASARAEHIKFKHVGPTLMCEICSRKFVTSHFLKQHISRHHDPSSKLYYGRSIIPPNLPLEQNMRKFVVKPED